MRRTICLIMALLLLAFASCQADQTEIGQSEPKPAEINEADNTSGKKVYFAAPLFSQGEKDYNLQLTQILEAHGYEVFLPQRDGYLAAELQGKTEEELTQMIFEKDLSEVLKADIVFMVLDGRYKRQPLSF